MMLWHVVPFSKLVVFCLFVILPHILLSMFYFILFESCVLMEWDMGCVCGLSFSFPLVLDKLSLVFSSVVVLISLSVMLFSVSYMSGDSSLEYFIIMVLLFVMSMNFLVYVPHLLFLLLGWDGLGLTSYLLVIYYQNDKSLSAGMITAMTNRIGDSFLILASCWAFVGGVWSSNVYVYNLLLFVVLCVGVGAMTKSAQVPFSAWLPAAMAAPTPVSSLVHSSTLVTAGIYVVIRFYPTLSGYDFFFLFSFYVGVLTCLMASFSALYESDLKKIVALSTLSQLGVMVMALGLGFPILSFFHLITHALFKALLFICAGTIIHVSLNNQDIRLMGSLWYTMPYTCMIFNVSNLALCGFPFMAGFYSKDMIVESFMYSTFPLSTSVMMMLSVCLTSGYVLRLSIMVLWSSFKGESVSVFSDSSFVVHLAMSVLVLGAVAGGAFYFWVLCPFVGVVVLPFYVKLVTLFFLFVVGVLSFMLVMGGCKWVLSYFMGSMWFLGFISSSPGVKLVFFLGDSYYMQEFSWVELFSGKGVMSFFSNVSSSFQSTQGFSLSGMLSLFTLVILFLVFVF